MSATKDPQLDEPCKHFLYLDECPYCFRDGAPQKKTPGRMVYISEYGKKYHFRPDCPSLEFGQQMVRDKGGNPSPIETVAEDSVKFDRDPCPQCKPGSKHNPL